ncbi:Cysteine-rich membrane protein 1 [Spironucleus salmonicida]|uniref:Cysteine-rich membrane protein 1 n=1 Tax=Spironucleus salmonicida TaxID=348837 RepID=V6LCX4_9EUKA|nr:Cysteine-rich membrane protein 1 [Spironucleus salmonicida]|eukprot:EST42335.1 Cysteine-rich membrane protein 1 [Spironucleus salmonicida]
MTETCTSESPCPTGFVCPDGATEETQDCLKCTVTGCQTCTKDALATCTACQPELFLDTDKCTACSPGCNTCSTAEACTACNDGFVLDESSCKECPANCKTCDADGSTCTVCNEDFIFKGSQCDKDECDADIPCKAGKFCNILQAGNRCADCETNCKSCTSADRCTACNHDYELNTDYTCSAECNVLNVNEACVSTANVPCGGTQQQTACNCGTANNCFTCPVVQPPKPDPNNCANKFCSCESGSPDACTGCIDDVNFTFANSKCTTKAPKTCGTCLPGYVLKKGKCDDCESNYTKIGEFCFKSSEEAALGGISGGEITAITIAALVVVCGVGNCILLYFLKKARKQQLK